MDDRSPPTGLRIVTINTGKCNGPYRARMRWLAGELSRLDPDIVALQEAFIAEDGSAHTPGDIAAALGAQVTVARARYKTRICEGRSVAGWSALALLSRELWIEQDVLHLPSDERDGERIALIGVAAYGDRRIVLANTHLTHLRDADHLRRAQLDAVLAHPLLTLPGSLRLLCGDLNTTADGPVLSPFLEGSRTPHLRDTSALGGGPEPRGTLAPRSGDPAPSQTPCIDFILALEDGDGAPLTFRESRIVLNRPRPNTGIYPSDHFGVMTTITQT